MATTKEIAKLLSLTKAKGLEIQLNKDRVVVYKPLYNNEANGALSNGSYSATYYFNSTNLGDCKSIYQLIDIVKNSK